MPRPKKKKGRGRPKATVRGQNIRNWHKRAVSPVQLTPAKRKRTVTRSTGKSARPLCTRTLRDRARLTLSAVQGINGPDGSVTGLLNAAGRTIGGLHEIASDPRIQKIVIAQVNRALRMRSKTQTAMLESLTMRYRTTVGQEGLTFIAQECTGSKKEPNYLLYLHRWDRGGDNQSNCSKPSICGPGSEADTFKHAAR